MIWQQVIVFGSRLLYLAEAYCFWQQTIAFGRSLVLGNSLLNLAEDCGFTKINTYYYLTISLFAFFIVELKTSIFHKYIAILVKTWQTMTLSLMFTVLFTITCFIF